MQYLHTHTHISTHRQRIEFSDLCPVHILGELGAHVIIIED
jgi:hypothetical protein